MANHLFVGRENVNGLNGRSPIHRGQPWFWRRDADRSGRDEFEFNASDILLSVALTRDDSGNIIQLGL